MVILENILSRFRYFKSLIFYWFLRCNIFLNTREKRIFFGLNIFIKKYHLSKTIKLNTILTKLV